MKSPLLPIVVPSIYQSGGVPVPLPRRMAHCPPDMKLAIARTGAALKQRGGVLRLSDLFRSYDMQLGSHLDWKSGKKRAFSPPPGGSLHEGGRALDLDLRGLKITLDQFWALAKPFGLVPIIASPNPRTSESWHFECRGSHTLIFDYYKAKKGTNFDKPYQAMAASAILSVDVKVDKFRDGQEIAYLQSGLIRLGQIIGNLDGAIGPRTTAGLIAVGITPGANATMVAEMDALLQQTFPDEYFDRTSELDAPFH